MPGVSMSSIPKSDLSEHEEEETPFDAVLRQLLSAKPTPMKTLKKSEREEVTSDQI